jgi:hypothetical protein
LYDRNDLNASPAHGEPAEDQDEKSGLFSNWFYQGVLLLFSLSYTHTHTLPLCLTRLYTSFLAPTRQLAFFFVFSYAPENRVYELLGDPLEILEMLETNTECRDKLSTYTTTVLYGSTKLTHDGVAPSSHNFPSI